MHYLLWTFGILAAALIGLSFVWGWASRRWTLPCPSVLAWTVDGSIADAVAGTQITLERMDLQPGMTIVEIGPGPGRLLVPAAERILPGGKAIGVELQQGMIDKFRKKLSRHDPGNIELIHADATNPVLTRESADLVYLCTVLGEIPDRAAALANCYDTLKHGGRLAITEIRGDPHYQSRAKVESLTRDAGFEPHGFAGNWWRYTATFHKP